MKRTLNSSKSHNGCSRCKARKLKCDEGRPACKVCVDAGAECPGFVPQLKWSRKHEKFDAGGGSQEPKSKARRKNEAKPAASPSLAEDTPVTTEENEQVVSPGDGTAVGAVTAPAGPPEQMDFDPAMMDWMNYGLGSFEDLTNDNMAQLFGGGQTFAQYDPLSGMASAENRMMPMGLDAYTLPLLSTPWHGNAHTASEGSGSYASPAADQAQPASNVPIDQDNDRKDGGSLLGAFYRLATPSKTARFSEEHLVQHYFSEVCSLYSCFDSDQNPFRSLVKEMRKDSATINLAIQSMAIAHLSNHYLYMAPLGRIKRMQSWKSLQIDLRRYRAGKIALDKVLMSCLLLGLSSAWHQPSDLGLQYLFIARNLIQMYLRSNRQATSPLPNEKFYLDAFMHWEMLASFFEPVAMVPFPGFGAPDPPLPDRGETVTPHPWTGVAPEMNFALAEVGRVLRRRMSRLAMMGDSYAAERSPSDEIDEQWSSSLERLLSSIRLPSVDDIESYADKYTPKTDLLRAAEAYRFIGLLELYMIVPTLLEARIDRGEPFPASLDNQPFPSPASNNGFPARRDSWLSAIALHTLQLIKPVSIHSSSCRTHLLILVSAGSQLRIPSEADADGDAQSEHHDKVLEGRGFVDARMLALSRKYPQKQVLQILDIIKEAWERLDRGESRVHWLGIAHEQGWQTMLG